MWVIKIGGSLHDAPPLRRWLAAVAHAVNAHVVIVPGGGPFADAVRTAQARTGFPHATAHRMAILAMQQYGLMLTGLERSLMPAETEPEIQAAHAIGRAAVWLPDRMLADAPDIEPGWDITSDSLAAWLATRLAAERLVLVKSASLPPAPPDPETLATAGILDTAFPAFARRFLGEITLAHQSDHEAFARAITSGTAFGLTVRKDSDHAPQV